MKTREKDNANWTVRRAAALALGQTGPVAKAAIPVLREALKEKPCSIWDGVVIALYPVGPRKGRSWLRNGSSRRAIPRSLSSPRVWSRREIVLGAMGRTSLEADVLTRRWLKSLNRNLAIELGRGRGRLELRDSSRNTSKPSAGSGLVLEWPSRGWKSFASTRMPGSASGRSRPWRRSGRPGREPTSRNPLPAVTMVNGPKASPPVYNPAIEEYHTSIVGE